MPDDHDHLDAVHEAMAGLVREIEDVRHHHTADGLWHGGDLGQDTQTELSDARAVLDQLEHALNSAREQARAVAIARALHPAWPRALAELGVSLPESHPWLTPQNLATHLIGTDHSIPHVAEALVHLYAEPREGWPEFDDLSYRRAHNAARALLEALHQGFYDFDHRGKM